MNFRENLRDTLEFIGMEQKELAEKTGLSLKTIENYVKKESSIPSADKAVLIAQAIGVTVEYLVNKQKPKKTDTSDIQLKNKEIIDILSKLNNYNREIIISMAKTLLILQNKNKSSNKKLS